MHLGKLVIQSDAESMTIWGFPKMGGYPNSWMVYTMENLKKNAGFGAARSEAKAQQDLKVSIIAS
jgi:hypothetical protein